MTPAEELHELQAALDTCYRLWDEHQARSWRAKAALPNALHRLIRRRKGDLERFREVLAGPRRKGDLERFREVLAGPQT